MGYSVLLLVFMPVLHGALRHLAVAAARLMVLGIGLSQVALGVHCLSHVFAVYAFGAAWVTAMIASQRVAPERGPVPRRPGRGPGTRAS